MCEELRKLVQPFCFFTYSWKPHNSGRQGTCVGYDTRDTDNIETDFKWVDEDLWEADDMSVEWHMISQNVPSHTPEAQWQQKKSSKVGRSDILAVCFDHSAFSLGIKSLKANAIKYWERAADFTFFIAWYERRKRCCSFVKPSLIKSTVLRTMVCQTWCGKTMAGLL